MKALFVFLLLAVSIVGAFQVGVPAWNSITQTRGELLQIQNAREQLDALAQKRDEALARLQSVSDSDLARLDLLLPNTPNTEDLYVFFELLTQEAGVELKSVSIDVPRSGDNILTFHIGVDGSYTRIRSLFDTIENNVRLMDVQSIDISHNEDNTFTLSITGRMYYGS